VSKLIDEVVMKIGQRVAMADALPRAFGAKDAAHAVLSEMFEERSAWAWSISTKREAQPSIVTNEVAGVPEFAQKLTILVPRAKAETTLAEAAKALAHALVPQMLVGECAIIGATEVNRARDAVLDALAREEKRP
jgi:hypothetical protein